MALETRELAAWATMLTRKRGLLLTALGSLTPAEVWSEIAGLQWELVIEIASHAYHYPDKKKRPHEIAKLRTSKSVLDRYAYGLIEAWKKRPA
jgi:hypothetical protein